ncbi:MAG: TraR/DksA family transcriptional regulator [Bacteroidetes bacterium]|nr:MAG: TraR/DksA family transcriptional regulator [Bacteroidota bacterium]RLD85952.1 MAG: TraR/DksA family transcriptional regulator [Bacteroidota bacterium]
MDAKQLEEVKNKIAEEIQKTEKSVTTFKEMTKPIAPDCAIGRISRMDAINNKSVAEAALREAEEKLSKLKYVLTKIDDEGFGLCVKCGKPIPIGRVLLMPQSRHCVHCAS